MTTSDQRNLDFIGDIHGQHDKLVGLLGKLGYQRDGELGFRHPQGRRVVFLGDYIDRGPKVRETLQTVKAMVDAGDALAIMGNHEFNAIAWVTPDPNPPSSDRTYLRHHASKNRKQHAATLSQFEGRESEWKDWLQWFKQLPMWLDVGGARAVHACWDSRSIEVLGAGSLQDSDFFLRCATRGSNEFHALETVLKGPELELPKGVTVPDKEGEPRKSLRCRWWGRSASSGTTLREIAMPPGCTDLGQTVASEDLEKLPNYADPVPVFVGHYWIPESAPRAPLAPNVACLDYSAGVGGPLVAYRWDGETHLRGAKMIAYR